MLHVAARYGDQKLFDRLHADAKKTTDRDERARLLGAMGAFIDPKIVDAGDGDRAHRRVRAPRVARALLQGGFQDPQTRADGATRSSRSTSTRSPTKLPAPYRAVHGVHRSSRCATTRQKPEIEAFFKPRIDKFDGGPRVMAQALEQLELCSAQRKAQTPGVVAFLKKQ